MEHVDGNVLAGPLAEFFSFDVTMATGRCVGCGTVVRCSTCDNVLATLVEADDRAWIGLRGVTAIEVRRTPTGG